MSDPPDFLPVAPARPTAPANGPGPRPITRKAASLAGGLTLLLGCVVGVAALYYFAVHTQGGQHADSALAAGTVASKLVSHTVAGPVLDMISIIAMVVATVVIVAIAVARRRVAVAIAAVVLVGGANLTTQILKVHVFSRPVFPGDYEASNYFPSGHTTVAASVALAVVLVVAASWRPLLATFGALYTTAIGVATVVEGWHRPSDIFAAVGVAGAWTALIIVIGVLLPTAGLGALGAQPLRGRRREARPPVQHRRWLAGMMLGIGAALMLACLTFGSVLGEEELVRLRPVEAAAFTLAAMAATCLLIFGAVAWLIRARTVEPSAAPAELRQKVQEAVPSSPVASIAQAPNQGQGGNGGS